MHSHYGINYSSKIRLKSLTKLLEDANKAHAEERLWQQWLVDYKRMDKTNFVSFEDYKNNAKVVVKTNEEFEFDKEKILEKAEAIKNAHQNRTKVNE